MPEEPIIKAKFKRSRASVLLSSVIFILCAYPFIKRAFDGIYIIIPDLVFGLLFGSAGISILYFASFLSDYFIYSNRIIIKSIYGVTKKTVFINEIESWRETEFVNRQKRVIKYVKFYTANSSFGLNADTYPDYDSVKQVLSKNKPRREQRDEGAYANFLKVSYVLLLIGTALLIYSYLLFQNYNQQANQITDAQLTSLHEPLAGRPSLVKESRKDGKIIYLVTLGLKNYPDYTFGAGYGIGLSQARSF